MYDNVIYLTNEGVSFNVVDSSESSAPMKIEEKAPLMTATVTRFADGSAVLGLGHSHCVQDGSSGWTFLAAWARNARGEKAIPPVDQRRKVVSQLPSDKEFDMICQKRL